MRSTTVILLCVVFSVVISPQIAAQTSISTDRPGFGYGAFTVPAGTYYIESGAISSQNSFRFGQLTFRTGLHERVEFQLKLGSLTHNMVDGWEISPQYIRFKVDLLHTKNKNFRSAIVNSTHLAFLDDEFDDYFNRVYLVAEYDFFSWFSLNANLGYGNYLFSDVEFPEMYYSINPSIQIDPETTLYLDYIYTQNDYYDQSAIEIGILYHIRSSVQIDGGLLFDDESIPYLNMGIAFSIN